MWSYVVGPQVRSRCLGPSRPPRCRFGTTLTVADGEPTPDALDHRGDCPESFRSGVHSAETTRAPRERGEALLGLGEYEAARGVPGRATSSGPSAPRTSRPATRPGSRRPRTDRRPPPPTGDIDDRCELGCTDRLSTLGATSQYNDAHPVGGRRRRDGSAQAGGRVPDERRRLRCRGLRAHQVDGPRCGRLPVPALTGGPHHRGPPTRSLRHEPLPRSRRLAGQSRRRTQRCSGSSGRPRRPPPG